MSSAFQTKALWAAIWSLIFAWLVFSRRNTEVGYETNSDDSQRYSPYISGSILPAAILILTIALILFYGIQRAAEISLSWWFGIFLHISLYYAVLLPILSFFRKHISARTCAMLWMIPNYLYLTQQSYMELPKPLLVIQAPQKIVWGIFSIWTIGFLGIFLWKVISHLMIRSRILQDAVTVTDPEILEIWNNEIKLANIKKPKFRLMVSPNVTTPLTIGLFSRSIRVVLPERHYTTDELALIFRHEIIHIGREDAWAKFFLVFCTAICWFNPLMWIAMRKCADDLELSCDETVLLDSDETVRRQYANLILKTAGDERGFTTCLSASAAAMRYRLKNIMKPKKRHSGAIVVGLIFFILCMSCGYVSLAYSNSTGSETIFQSEKPENYLLRHIAATDDPYQTTYQCSDTDKLYHYLSELRLSKITGNYSYDEYEKQFTFIYDTPKGVLSLVLSDDMLKLVRLYDDRNTSYYYLPDGVDWEYLDTLIFSYPALNIQTDVSKNNMNYTKTIPASLGTLVKEENGETTVLYKRNPLEDPSGFFGYGATEVKFDFSHTPVSEYSVKIESWDRQSSYIVSQNDLEQEDVLPLAGYHAHYTIYATFSEKDGSTYKAEFLFDFGGVD